MLEAISDFWKPVKKSSPQEKLRPEQLQQGSVIGFGFVPQATLSGRKLTVNTINTYRFGEENLTSFVLGEKETGVSMIVAESEGEQYLAISRRLTISDRMKMFLSDDLENVMEKADVTQLSCKDVPGDYKGWMVPFYKREIQGLQGRIFKGDFRKAPTPAIENAQEFKYTLLVSDNNEHAIEIEKYNDGRVEVYATIYRRLSDVAEVTQPARVDQLNRPDLKIASKPEEKPMTPPVAANTPKLMEAPNPIFQKPGANPEIKPEPIKLQEFTPTAMPPAPPVAEPKIEPVKMAETFTTETIKTEIKTQETPMLLNEPATNGAMKDMNPATAEKPKLTAYSRQEVQTVSKPINGLDNEAVECELKVANKIIDEAIRNEMRLSDVVRRIIELPVAGQETVHIPLTLSEEDYALLAIRYGMSPSDRSAIKTRIIEDLNDFSGDNKRVA